ncbi:hypothetical protein Pyn_38234 [Prunus yedoensis var. nudiflora]|uniref:Uncharacterized protein n=1 Tax=Prunus yedoensis var. nudiflora TaxID=2094558 RepID=A0A314ZTK2_PRUYE|nr:hypothetical protein Pyn_38234 [Prunus yedoensis var. nudiflora]
MTLKRPRPKFNLNKCQSLYFYSLAADYGFDPNALDPDTSWPLKQIMAKISAEIKRATESAESCVKDFVFG